MKTIASVVGARPQFVKAGPVSRALASDFKEVLIHTGQHYDHGMSEVFFEEMKMPRPAYNLGVAGGPHGEQTGKMLVELEKVIEAVRPDGVLIYGDTNSTLAGALVAAKSGLPLAHVEAGLRSYDRSMPEEINRVISDHVSNVLFCPTETAVENLVKEGITDGVHCIGDVMYDALLSHLESARRQSQIMTRLGLGKREYALTTIHRAANADDPDRMRSIVEALGGLTVRVVFPVHPRTQRMIKEFNLDRYSNILMIEPVSYFDMLVLEENASCVLTDSGGVQKEAYLLGTRCITLREETEWVETVAAGWNRLVGTNPQAIRSSAESWFPAGEHPALYGDGHASERICQILTEAWK
jgi:UDP-GlcNAc3NAcA epimerase